MDGKEGKKENKTAEKELPLPVWKEKETDWRTRAVNDKDNRKEREREKKGAAKPSSMKDPKPLYLVPDKAPEAYQPMGNFN